MRLTVCGSADLARALINGDHALAQALARLLGLQETLAPAPRVIDAEVHFIGTSKMELAPVAEQEIKPQPLLEVPFWRVEAYESLASDSEIEPEMPSPAPDLTPLEESPPSTRPLAPWSELQSRLRHALTEQREGAEPDLDAAVRHLSQGRLLERIPRQAQRRWSSRLQIIRDRSERLVPYWSDQDSVCQSLLRLLPREDVEQAVYWEGLPTPRLLTDKPERTYRTPPSGSTVLVLGDLGCVVPGVGAACRLWADLGRRLREAGCRPVALLPGPLACCPSVLRDWELLPWERLRTPAVCEPAARRAIAAHLLALVSPAVRIEPGLLREVRLLLTGEGADAGTEAEVWQRVASTSSAAASLDPETAKKLREVFADEPQALREWVLSLLRDWRRHLPREIWYEEVQSLAPSARDALPDQRDLERARKFFQRLSRQAEAGKAVEGALTWFRRCERRLTASAWTDEQAGPDLQRLSWLLHRNDPDYRPPPGFKPSDIKAPDQPRRRCEIHQRGGELILVLDDQMPETVGSFLGSLYSRNGLIKVDESLPPPFWKDVVKPDWVAKYDRDEFGLWASFTVETVTQRLRWIPPGRFLMGSPDDEPGRYNREGPQHEVTLTQGYWLFDTACTQALWQAVMGENPSHYQGPTRPVENVSWDDCQEFIQRLNQRIPGLDLQLPTEAQWEYACRAGTTTPYSFGEDITPEHANRGNETVPVASLPANPWGLYEMHGNVYEWCLDSQRKYGNDSVTDPIGPTTAGVGRVFRGGSWLAPARYLRSADRLAYDPGYRFDYLGVRCARVQAGAEPHPEGAELAGPEADRGAEPRSDRVPTSAAGFLRLDIGAEQAKCSIPPAQGLIISSDSSILTLRRRPRPAWARAMGRDRFGLWAEIALEATEDQPVIQRMRWIPPGRFLMGSPERERAGFPEDERHWFDREGPQHEVTLSQGYWLFDTPCTQALWQAVMGTNPSEYQTPDRPVEQVSWEDAQSFLENINQRIPGLDLVLPSEAQWEYACRAGTETATYAGDLEILGERNAPILDSIAWYGGNSGVDFELENGYDIADWPEKQYPYERAGTHPVGLKAPNPWALYDMLGNVFEWCEDGMREYQEDEVKDPRGPVEAGVVRVIRGGSWAGYARYLRSAYRDAFVPGYRIGHLGFRCARVQA